MAVNSVRTAVSRQFAAFLSAAVADGVEVTRRVPREAPNPYRIAILPGTAEATEPFLGHTGRAARDDEFTIVASIEAVGGDDQDELEDQVDVLVNAVEDTVAVNRTLGGLDGVTMFGVTVQTTPHPVVELTSGVLYQWVEIEISVRARYD